MAHEIVMLTKKSILIAVLVFVVGICIGAFAASAYVFRLHKSLNDISALMTRASLENESIQLYKNGDARVAIYALNKAREARSMYPSDLAPTQSSDLDEAIFHARIGKLREKLGESQDAERNFQESLVSLKKVGWVLKDSK